MASMDQDNVKLGLLMETAQAHQKLAEAVIAELGLQVNGFAALATDQIQTALGEALEPVHMQAQGVVEALQRAKRAANLRSALWTVGITAPAAAIALFVAWCVLPTQAQVNGLRTERDELASNIAALDHRGARADIRRCGAGRLCVRVDLKAPRYGEGSDYLIIKGY
jgi:hypothetical protein